MGNRMLNWFTSKNGRDVMATLTGVAASGIAAAHILPHSWLIDRYKNIVQMYRGGKEVILPDAVANRAKEVLHECGLSEGEENVFKFFTILGLDMFHMGSTKVRGGPYIGIPHTFSYVRVEDVEKEELLVHGGKFDFNSSVGRELLNSLVLSDRAQRFAIAREIQASTTHYVYFQALFSAVSLLLAYSFAALVNTRLNFFKLPRKARLVMYGFTGSIGLANYIMLKDGLFVYYDREADNAACRMGRDYVLGGIEYYENLLVRNRALRDALGDRGKSQYTMFGNEEVFIRTKRLPITAHLDLVKDIFKETEQQSQVKTEPETSAKAS